jgi:hypothetical protein
MIFLILFMLVLPAHATDYQIDLPIKAPMPIYKSADTTIVAGISYGAVAAGVPDQVIPSSWSYIDCHIRNGNAMVLFSATPATWPSSWPTSVTCQGGGDSVTITLTDNPAADTFDNDPNFTPSQGLTVQAPEDTAFVQQYNLPSNGDYTEGSWAGRESPTKVWTGVYCDVGIDASGPHLALYIAGDVDTKDGYCVLPNSQGGAPYIISVDFDRT